VQDDLIRLVWWWREPIQRVGWRHQYLADHDEAYYFKPFRQKFSVIYREKRGRIKHAEN
jgi:hypothetical protein